MPRLLRLFGVLSAFCYFCAQSAHAGYFLHVHFGNPNDARSIQSAAEVVTSPIGAVVGDTVTANFLLELTGASTLYSYRFSVRYNTDRFEFLSRHEESRPDSWLPILNLDNSEPLPVAQSGESPLAGNFQELRRFDGESRDPLDDIGSGFYHLGHVTYRLTSLPQSGELLIQPGRFEQFEGSGTTVEAGLEDKFLAEQAGEFLEVSVVFQQGIIAVPEPSSFALLLLGVGGVFSYQKLRRRIFIRG